MRTFNRWLLESVVFRKLRAVLNQMPMMYTTEVEDLAQEIEDKKLIPEKIPEDKLSAYLYQQATGKPLPDSPTKDEKRIIGNCIRVAAEIHALRKHGWISPLPPQDSSEPIIQNRNIYRDFGYRPGGDITN